MRESQSSRIIKISNVAELSRLIPNTAAATNQWMLPPYRFVASGSGSPLNNGRGRGRGGYNTRARANYQNDSS